MSEDGKRLEELRHRWGSGYPDPKHYPAMIKDINFLISEVDRLDRLLGDFKLTLAKADQEIAELKAQLREGH